MRKTVNKTKITPSEGEKYLQIIYLIRDYIQNVQRSNKTQHKKKKKIQTTKATKRDFLSILNLTGTFISEQ